MSKLLDEALMGLTAGFTVGLGAVAGKNVGKKMFKKRHHHHYHKHHNNYHHDDKNDNVRETKKY